MPAVLLALLGTLVDTLAEFLVLHLGFTTVDTFVLLLTTVSGTGNVVLFVTLTGGGGFLTILKTEDSLVLKDLEELVETGGDGCSKSGTEPVDPV